MSKLRGAAVLPLGKGRRQLAAAFRRSGVVGETESQAMWWEDVRATSELSLRALEEAFMWPSPRTDWLYAHRGESR